MTAPPIPPNDEQLDQLAASGEPPVVTSDGDECLTSAQDMPTQIAPPIPDDDKPPTVVAPYAFPEAYSEEPPERVGRSWRVAWQDAAAIAAAGLLIAIGVGGGWWVFTHHSAASSSGRSSVSAVPTSPPVVPPTPPPVVPVPEPPPPVTVTVAPPAPVPSPPPAPPPPVSRGPSTAEQDAQFLSLITADGMAITDAGAATAGARAMCAGLAAGQSPASIAAGAMANNSTLSRGMAQMILAAAIAAYCPQYE
ncbi:MAG: DUF732 domain-containing protein [Mycobacterium sp.]|uniref:DUF732 domain-containing protein n=1 Tax=Mycobacterium sp. TaxID=1785 RepID=UPI003F986C15